MSLPPIARADACATARLPGRTDRSGPMAGWRPTRQPCAIRASDNVFVVGDVAGVPKGKTAASVKWQVPVAADHLVGTISGTPATSAYNG